MNGFQRRLSKFKLFSSYKLYILIFSFVILINSLILYAKIKRNDKEILYESLPYKALEKIIEKKGIEKYLKFKIYLLVIFKQYFQSVFVKKVTTTQTLS